MPERLEFLVVYDYGSGGVWLRILADSREQIHARYYALDVVDARPSWMDDEIFSSLPIVDIDDSTNAVLKSLPPA